MPDARAIADELAARQVSLNLGGTVYDPTDAVGRLLFNVLAMVAEFEADLIRLRTKEGMRVANAKGHLRGKQPKLNRRQEARLVSLVVTVCSLRPQIGKRWSSSRHAAVSPPIARTMTTEAHLIVSESDDDSIAKLGERSTPEGAAPAPSAERACHADSGDEKPGMPTAGGSQCVDAPSQAPCDCLRV